MCISFEKKKKRASVREFYLRSFVIVIFFRLRKLECSEQVNFASTGIFAFECGNIVFCFFRERKNLRYGGSASERERERERNRKKEGRIGKENEVNRNFF